MPGYRLFINKGACPPGTAAALESIFRAKTRQPYDIIVNPDFLKAGKAIDDFMQPDRVIVGCEDVRVQELIREIYSPFLRTGRPILFMSKASAEMTKYATTVMLASRISMMNQLAEISTVVGANISEVREGVASDGRIGSTFLFPGLGYGGVHLPGDVDACIHFAAAHGVNADLVKAVKAVNERCQEHFEGQILDYYGDTIAGKTIAIWGATFKPRTDDIRGSIAIRIIDRLLERGAKVQAHDPMAGPGLEARYQGRITVASKPYDALDGAHGLVIATEWSNYRRPAFGRMAELMAERVIFDGRNLFRPEDMSEHGFTYFSVGR
jgi:UDPglucose 6-dehydrogenase